MKLFLIALYPDAKFPLMGESLGICAISGYLKRFSKDVSVSLYDQQFDTNDTIINDIISYKPDIIAFSVKVFTFNKFIEFYTSMKEKDLLTYSPLIVLGNSVAHFSGESIFTEYGFHDVIISLGEGEVSFPSLCEYKKGRIAINEIPNIMYYENGVVKRTPFLYLNKNDIPIADRSFSKSFHQKGGEIYIESSRGCAYCSCSICECRDFLGSYNPDFKWRDKPIDSVIEELHLLHNEGINTVNFADEDFIGPDFYGVMRAIRLSDKIIRNKTQVKFRINARVKSIFNLKDTQKEASLRIEMLKRLKAAGLDKVFLGFESGVQSQLNRYGKGFLLEEFIQAKKILDDHRIEYELGFIPIDPLVTIEELTESLTFIKIHNCIPFISSIYKELRIQSGNKTYLNKIRNYEKQHNKLLVKRLQINNQQYEITRYADERIERVVKNMAPYISNRYKIYYQFRRETQYSSKTMNKDVSFQLMSLIKQSDYDLFLSIVKSVSRDKSDKYLADLVCFTQQRIMEQIKSNISVND